MKINHLLTSLSQECSVSNRLRMSQAYDTISNRLCKFHGDSPALTAVFTKEQLHRFQDKLFSDGLEHNTIVFYNSILRVAYNKAIAQKQLKATPKLFDTLYTTPIATAKRALSTLDIARIMAADLATEPILEETRDLFMLCFLLQGMPFIDLMHLRKSELNGAVINYRRRKTDSPITVALLPQTCTLLRKYMDPTGKGPHLLPYVTCTGAAGRTQYNTVLRYYNDNLKLLADRLGIEEDLTSYSARHSWATIAHHQDIDVSIVSQGMGHQTEQITHTYLSDFGHARLLQANETVMASSLKLIFEGLVPGLSPKRMAEMERMRDENLRSLQPADTDLRKKPKGMQDILLHLMEDLREVRNHTQSESELQLVQDFQVKAAETLQRYVQQQPLSTTSPGGEGAQQEPRSVPEELTALEELDLFGELAILGESPNVSKPPKRSLQNIRPHKLCPTREIPPQDPVSDPPKRKRSNKHHWHAAKKKQEEIVEKVEMKTIDSQEAQSQKVEINSLPPDDTDDHTINKEINTQEMEGDAKNRPKQKRIRQLVIDGFRHCKSRD